MKSTRSSIVNGTLIVMGILGYLVLCLPWYELTSSSYGFGYSSDLSAGVQSGFVAAGVTTFGYGLYALPGGAIALAFKKNYPTRAKALLLEFIGVFELLCMFFVNKEMGSFDTDISGSGFSAHAGFEIFNGYWISWGVYILTGVVGLIMCIVAPKPQDEEAEQTYTETPSVSFPEKWVCETCGTENSLHHSQCKKCGRLISGGYNTTVQDTTPDNIAPTSVVTPVAVPEKWECKNCRTVNSMKYGQCKKCGQFR